MPITIVGKETSPLTEKRHGRRFACCWVESSSRSIHQGYRQLVCRWHVRFAGWLVRQRGRRLWIRAGLVCPLLGYSDKPSHSRTRYYSSAMATLSPNRKGNNVLNLAVYCAGGDGDDCGQTTYIRNSEHGDSNRLDSCPRQWTWRYPTTTVSFVSPNWR